MKSQIYIRISAIQEFGPLVINALGTYFKNTLVNHLKTGPQGRKSPYFFFATAFLPAGDAAACC
jgi:hypothetical protein